MAFYLFIQHYSGVPLGNLGEITHATVNETVKSRFFSLTTGFRATTRITYSSTMHRYTISMPC